MSQIISFHFIENNEISNKNNSENKDNNENYSTETGSAPGFQKSLNDYQQKSNLIHNPDENQEDKSIYEEETNEKNNSLPLKEQSESKECILPKVRKVSNESSNSQKESIYMMNKRKEDSDNLDESEKLYLNFANECLKNPEINVDGAKKSPFSWFLREGLEFFIKETEKFPKLHFHLKLIETILKIFCERKHGMYKINDYLNNYTQLGFIFTSIFFIARFPEDTQIILRPTDIENAEEALKELLDNILYFKLSFEVTPEEFFRSNHFYEGYMKFKCDKIVKNINPINPLFYSIPLDIINRIKKQKKIQKFGLCSTQNEFFLYRKEKIKKTILSNYQKIKLEEYLFNTNFTPYQRFEKNQINSNINLNMSEISNENAFTPNSFFSLQDKSSEFTDDTSYLKLKKNLSTDKSNLFDSYLNQKQNSSRIFDDDSSLLTCTSLDNLCEKDRNNFISQLFSK